MKQTKHSGNPATPPTPALITLQQHLRTYLHPTLARLRGVQAAITTSALALRAQNSDADADIAHVLVRAAADPLDAEIERIETLLNALDGRALTEPSFLDIAH